MGGRPLLAVDGRAAARINVRGHADVIHREAQDDAAAEIVQHRIAFALVDRRAFLCVEPCGVYSDTQIPGEEVIEPDATAPTVITEELHLIRAFSDRVLSEDVELELVIRETGRGSYVSFGFFALNHRSATEGRVTAEGESCCDK